MTITKENIERLKELREFLAIIKPKLLKEDEWINSLDNAIAQLTQPYQYDELIDVAVAEDFYTFVTGSYIASAPNGDVIVTFGDGALRRFKYHRPIKQTVQVTLDKELDRKSEELDRSLNHFDDPDKMGIGYDSQLHNDLKWFFANFRKAIAQEGEE